MCSKQWSRSEWVYPQLGFLHPRVSQHKQKRQSQRLLLRILLVRQRLCP